MKELFASRSFVYSTDIDDIKNFLEQQNFQVIERLHSQTGEPLGFTVEGTTIRVGYQTIMQGRFVSPGKPMISLLNTPETTHGDSEYARRSIDLYEKLYRKFRKKART